MTRGGVMAQATDYVTDGEEVTEPSHPCDSPSQVTIPMFAGMRFIAISAFAAAAAASAALAGGRGESPVVVELYTSQGCSGCLQASAYASELAEREGVLLLSFGVDYWDYLGWEDTFAKPGFVERQRLYTERLENRHPYTPQMVVDGHVNGAGFNREFVDIAVAHCFEHIANSPSVSFSREDDQLTVAIGDGDSVDEDADVWLVTYLPGVQMVDIDRGENADAAMRHYNVVESIHRIGAWNGDDVTLTAPIISDRSHAVLVQRAHQGAMIAAAAE